MMLFVCASIISGPIIWTVDGTFGAPQTVRITPGHLFTSKTDTT